MSSVTYGDLTGDGQDEAAVDLRYSTGGTLSWHYLYLFTVLNGTPKMLSLLRSGSRADGGLESVEISEGVLILEFSDGERRRGDCCSLGVVRARYRFVNGAFVKVGKLEKDSSRVGRYPLLEKSGPRTVRHTVGGRTSNIVFTDGAGVDRALTSSGNNVWPDLSVDGRSVVFLKEEHDEPTEIRAVNTDGSNARSLYRDPVQWNGRSCPPSTFRAPKWSLDGRSVYFVTDCTSKSGALWRLEVGQRSPQLVVAEAVNFGVLRAGRFKGYLVADQRTLTAGAEYPVYLYFLFTKEGERVRQVGGEDDELEALVEGALKLTPCTLLVLS